MNKKNIGTISLAISVLGILFIYIGTYFIKDSFLLEMLLAGFEAAVVGSIADWFAVTALFKEIPIPFVKKHTNIVVKSRAKLTTGIADLVENEWLSKGSILKKISSFFEVKALKVLLSTKKNQMLATDAVVALIQNVIRNNTARSITSYIHNNYAILLNNSKVEEKINAVLSSFMIEKKHHKYLEFCLTKLELALQSEVVLRELEEVVASEVQNYKRDKSTFAKIVIEVTQTVGGLDNNAAAVKLQDAVVNFIREIRENSKHDIRVELDNELTRLVCDADESTQITELFKKSLHSIIFEYVSEKNVQALLNKINVDANKKDSKLYKTMLRFVEKQANKLACNNEQLSRIQALITTQVAQVVVNNHAVIAKTVTENLSKLDDNTLVKQIEDKVGDDLQYIRLNGALIGSFVGILLFNLKNLLSLF